MAEGSLGAIGEWALAWVKKCLDEVRAEIVMLPDDGTLFLTRNWGAVQ
ncbi:MAG TPA: hypothetical protein VFX04_03240 [Rhodanobacteraceae bacterium]|nr:hypothetical protein [Rhodanobacteraceae bacterium]